MKKISRRQFLSSGAAILATTLPCRNFLPSEVKTCEAAINEDIRGKVFKGDAPNKLWKWSKEGFLYKKLGKNKVVCGICPNRCVLSPGDRSVCRSKVNMEGKLYSLAYGNPCSVNTDPIEKKPLYHFKPRTKAFSLATTGCNFRCLNCQNYEISQAKPDEVINYELFPSDAVKAAIPIQSPSLSLNT
jgi:pyruvate formate lyase activating enzyme